MSKIYKRNCNNCNKYYEGSGYKFCSLKCSHEGQKGQTVWNKNKKGLQIAWNKDLTHETDNRVKCTPRSIKFKRRQSKIAKQNGVGLWNIGRKQTEEWKEKRLSKTRGEKHYNWRDGLSKSERNEKLAGRKKPERCEICGTSGTICFDHDHKTGKFRGWICKRCNFILGFAKDNTELLEKVIEYLKTHKNK